MDVRESYTEMQRRAAATYAAIDAADAHDWRASIRAVALLDRLKVQTGSSEGNGKWVAWAVLMDWDSTYLADGRRVR